jgi:exodeoxyribonuclease VII small subunit
MAKSSFEKDLEKLEGIVEALEEGGLSLDDALKKFEEGMKLAHGCEKALSAAEKKIEILIKNADGTLTGEPFGDEPGEGAAPRPAPAADPAQVPVPDADEDDEDPDLLF